MGPWYFNADDSTVFANFPANQNRLYRVPRNPAADLDGDLTESTAGINGIFVNGVALFDMTDIFSYDTASGYDGTTALSRRASDCHVRSTNPILRSDPADRPAGRIIHTRRTGAGR